MRKEVHTFSLTNTYFINLAAYCSWRFFVMPTDKDYEFKINMEQNVTFRV